MNAQLLADINQQIQEGKFPVNHRHFGGANLIISDDSTRNHHEGDRLVITEHAAQISWLIDQLKEAYKSPKQSLRKHEFYNLLGKTAADSLHNGDDIFQVLENMVSHAAKWDRDTPDIKIEEDEFDGHGP